MIISVTSLKGGVGKSTITQNLAVCFAQSGYRVCIADAEYVLCPVCKFVSPNDTSSRSPTNSNSARNGVGLGLLADQITSN